MVGGGTGWLFDGALKEPALVLASFVGVPVLVVLDGTAIHRHNPGAETNSLALRPRTEPGSVPNHGRIVVFIAKEIICLHGSELLTGPGFDGPEILISIRSWGGEG